MRQIIYPSPTPVNNHVLISCRLFMWTLNLINRLNATKLSIACGEITVSAMGNWYQLNSCIYWFVELPSQRFLGILLINPLWNWNYLCYKHLWTTCLWSSLFLVELFVKLKENNQATVYVFVEVKHMVYKERERSFSVEYERFYVSLIL